MDTHLSCSLLRDSLNLLTSNSYKKHRFYQPYLESCFFVFDYRFLSLSFSQFQILLLLLLRRNFSTRLSIISESISPLPESIPDSRLEYIFKSLQTKNIIKKHTRNIFELITNEKAVVKLPYSYLLNTLISINESNCNYFKLLLYFSFTRFISFSNIQHTLHIRKSTSCAIFKSFQENRELIDSTLFPISEQIKCNSSSHRHNNSTISTTKNKTFFSYTQLVPDSVPVSKNMVPDSSVKYVLNNNINNQSNLNNLAIKWALESTDRFFSQNELENRLNIIEPSASFCRYLCLFDDLKKLFSNEEYLFISALSTVARLQSYFSSFGDSILFKSVAEVFLTIRDKKYSSTIQNFKAYFFKSLRNALSTSNEYYPNLQKLIDKQKIKNIQQIQKESTEKHNAIEDKIYEDSIVAYEKETGHKINGVFDNNFAQFYSEFRSRLISTKTDLNDSLSSNQSEPAEDDLIEIAYEQKRDRFESEHSHKFNKDDSCFNPIINYSTSAYSWYKSLNRNCENKENVVLRSNTHRSNIMVRLINGKEISSDEYSFLPLHIQGRCDYCGINACGEALYKLKKIE